MSSPKNNQHDIMSLLEMSRDQMANKHPTNQSNTSSTSSNRSVMSSGKYGPSPHDLRNHQRRQNSYTSSLSSFEHQTQSEPDHHGHRMGLSRSTSLNGDVDNYYAAMDDYYRYRYQRLIDNQQRSHQKRPPSPNGLNLNSVVATTLSAAAHHHLQQTSATDAAHLQLGSSVSPYTFDPDRHPADNLLAMAESGCGVKEKGACNVCGEKAFYKFYGTLACDSCRTFFRRHVLQNKKLLNCHFNDCCDINPRTRKDCSKCRLNKCLLAGMRVELVATNETERITRGRATDFDRLASRTQALLTESFSSTPAPRSKESVEKLVSSAEIESTAVAAFDLSRAGGGATERSQLSRSVSLDNVNYAVESSSTSKELFVKNRHRQSKAHASVEQTQQRPTKKHESSSGSSLSVTQPVNADAVSTMRSLDPTAGAVATIDRDDLLTTTAIRAPSTLSTTITTQRTIDPNWEKTNANLDTISKITMSSKRSVTDTETPVDEIVFDGWYLKSQDEKKLFIEVVMAANEFKSHQFEVKSGSTEIVMATNLLYFGIERILCACRCFTPYEELSTNDHSALLRGGCSEMLLLRSAHHVDLDGDSWVLDTRQVDGRLVRTQVSLKVFTKIQGGDSPVYKCYVEYVKSIDKRWRLDNVVLTLLLAIVLFTPDRPYIEEPEIVERLRNLYQNLLRQYLNAKLGETQADEIFEHLTKSLELLKVLREAYDMSTVDLSDTKVNLMHDHFIDLSLEPK